MIDKRNPIGAIDSGVGGLTVVRELQRLLPGEDIVYFGDSANCPYGNKTGEQIFQLGRNMLTFLSTHHVKCVAVACNTLSSMVGRLRPCFDFHIVSIVEEAAKYMAESGLSSVGLIGTEFTVAAGKYDELIHQLNPDCRIISKGSPLLSGLVDRGDFNQREINLEITTQVDHILAREAVDHLILGCTHYPIVTENFRACYPDLELIDPAYEQAKAVKAYLEANDALNPQETGSLCVYTSGDPKIYADVARRLSLSPISRAETVQL